MKTTNALAIRVLEQARGRWPSIFDELGIQVQTNGLHGPCPVCGGKDRFRFDDKQGRGTWFCNQCRPKSGDGLALIQKVKGWEFRTALPWVAKAISYREEESGNGRGKRSPVVLATPPRGTLGVDLYAYHDAIERPVIYVKRSHHQDGSKSFCQWGLTADKMGWQAKLDYAPKPRPLYRLPAILAAEGELVVFHEGEKATEAAIKANLPGIHSTTIGGASNPRHSDFSPLIGLEVVVCPDNDDDGERFAASVALLAQGAGAKSVRILRLPGLPSKGDVVEWLTGGGTAAQFSESLNQVEALKTDGPSGPDGPSAIAKESDAQAQSRERVGPHEPGPVQFPTVPGYRIAKEGVFEVPKDDDKPEVRLTLAPCGVPAETIGDDPTGEPIVYQPERYSPTGHSVGNQRHAFRLANGSCGPMCGQPGVGVLYGGIAGRATAFRRGPRRRGFSFVWSNIERENDGGASGRFSMGRRERPRDGSEYRFC